MQDEQKPDLTSVDTEAVSTTHTEAPENQPEATTAVSRGVLAVLGLIAAAVVVFFVFHRSSGKSAAPQLTVTAPTPATALPVADAERIASQSPTPANQLNLSLSYINGGQPGRASTVLHALLAADPRNASAWNNLCVAQVQLRELADAAASCNRALGIDGNFQLAKNNLKWANDVRQAETDALTKLEQTSSAGRDSKFYLAEGNYHLHLGEYDQAIDSWQQLLSQNANDASAANNIGTAYMLKHQPTQAKTWFAKAEAWDPKLQLAKNNMAWADEELAAKSH